MSDQSASEKMYTVVEAAKKTGASRHTVNNWIRAGRFPRARKVNSPVGDYWLIPESDVKNVKVGKRGRPRKKPQPIVCPHCGREI